MHSFVTTATIISGKSVISSSRLRNCFDTAFSCDSILSGSNSRETQTESNESCQSTILLHESLLRTIRSYVQLVILSDVFISFLRAFLGKNPNPRSAKSLGRSIDADHHLV
jgi:hypothetical protein